MTDFHPIAKVSVGQILGLVEAIDEVGGVADVATISQEVEMDVDRLGPILDAAEFLGLLMVHEGDVRITDLSRKLLSANVRERKAILREIIHDTPDFRMITDMGRNAGRPLTRKGIIEALAVDVGSHRRADLVKAMVYWGRYVELLRYDRQSQELTLRTPSK